MKVPNLKALLYKQVRGALKQIFSESIRFIVPAFVLLYCLNYKALGQIVSKAKARARRSFRVQLTRGVTPGLTAQRPADRLKPSGQSAYDLTQLPRSAGQFLNDPVGGQPVHPTPDLMGALTVFITYDRLLKDVQEEFTQKFPFLKIEFFRKGHDFISFSQRKDYLPSQITFGKSYRDNKTGTLEITPSMTVKGLERKCEEQFGILVRVYRKSGNVWLETLMTENWTIKQQNDHGGEITLN